MNRKKIIVIGATGETGTYLVDELVANNEYEVIACGYNNVKPDYYKKRGIQFARLDITKSSDFLDIPSDNVDTVVLLSGYMPARMKGYHPQKYLDVHTTGTLNTLEYCRRNNIKNLIFAQSHSDVAGYWNTGRFIKDDDYFPIRIGDHAVYIISKNAAVDLIKHYQLEFGIRGVIFRLPTIYCYGPYNDMYVNGKLSYVPYRKVIQKALNGESIEIWGDPKVAKDIVYVKDFIQMIINAIKTHEATGMFNVGTGIATTLEEQILGIVDVFSPKSKRSKISYQPEKKSQVSYLYDVSKAKNILKYQVNYPYLKMLEDIKIEMGSSRFNHLM